MMSIEVAVFAGGTGETVSIYEPGNLTVYTKKNGTWTVLREAVFVLARDTGLNALRRQMEDMLAFLDGCAVFTARSIVGIPYYELEKAGCSVWEFAGKPQEFLDYILSQEEEAQREQPACASAVPVPVDAGEGRYQISLKNVQASANGVTSKQVLLPFLRKGEFYSLEVMCNHVPPWLEAEFLGGSLSGLTERTGTDEVRITITKNCCNGL